MIGNLTSNSMIYTNNFRNPGNNLVNIMFKSQFTINENT